MTITEPSFSFEDYEPDFTLNTKMDLSRFLELWQPFKPKAGDAVYSSEGKAISLLPRTREEAITYTHIQLNNKRPIRVNMLVVDYDHPQSDWAVSLLVAAGVIPAPNCITYRYNPETNERHAHMLFVIDGYVAEGQEKALEFFNSIRTGLNAAINGSEFPGADFGYTNTTTQTPDHPSYETVWGPNQLYTLKELARYAFAVKEDVAGKAKKERRNNLPDLREVTEGGRNIALRQVLGEWAWVQFHRTTDDEQFLDQVTEKAEELNELFPYPMNDAEWQAVARNIAAFPTKHGWRRADDLYKQKMRNRASYRSDVKNKANRYSKVLTLIEEGLSYPQIAESMNLSPTGVKQLAYRARKEANKQKV